MAPFTASRAFAALGALALLAGASPALAAGTQVIIVNADAPGEGFNDPTPAAPVGGNAGTTVGEQRLIAFQFAANIWGQALDSNVPIFVESSFDPLTCTATSATLGSAGAVSVFADFQGAPQPGLWFSAALANRLAGEDLDPTGPEIRARFNSSLGQPGCLDGGGWYYGLDNNEGTQTDLVAVLLHEMAHGLGFQNFVNEATGANLAGRSDIYSFFTLDVTTGKTWNEMTDEERRASALNVRNVSWRGPAVTASVPERLQPGVPFLNVSGPPDAAGDYLVGTAAWGRPLDDGPLEGPLQLALDPADPAGPSPTDACSPLTESLAGKVALIDRGTCAFTVKALNAQNAGAIAAIFVNNAPGSPPPTVGGADPEGAVTIPVASVTLADGNRLKAALAAGAAVTTRLDVDLTRFAGADPEDRALLYAVDPVALGSSISHFDISATPNLLMEPAINRDLTTDLDLTVPLLYDEGWSPLVDLSLTIEGPASVTPGIAAAFTFVVRNAGPSTAEGVTLSADAPPGLALASVAGEGCEALPCVLGALPEGEERRVTVTFNVPADYEQPVPVAVAGVLTSTTAEQDPSDNAAAFAAGVASEADVSVSVSLSNFNLAANRAEFTIIVTNVGPSASTDVSLDADLLSPVGQFVSNAGDCQNAYPCQLGTLGPGEVKVVRSTYRFPRWFPALFARLSATAFGADADPDPSNNTDRFPNLASARAPAAHPRPPETGGATLQNESPRQRARRRVRASTAAGNTSPRSSLPST